MSPLGVAPDSGDLLLLDISAVGIAAAVIVTAVNSVVLTLASVFAKDPALRRRARRAHRRDRLVTQLLAIIAGRGR